MSFLQNEKLAEKKNNKLKELIAKFIDKYQDS